MTQAFRQGFMDKLAAIRSSEDLDTLCKNLHEVAEFPEQGISMKDWYAEMLKNPVKKAELEKKASSKKETYESGEGEVESFTPDKTDGHDEIVLRLKNGKKIVISNNTRIGIRVIPAEGDHIGYNGYHINGTNVVHKVHSNKHQRGGWLEHSAGF